MINAPKSTKTDGVVMDFAGKSIVGLKILSGKALNKIKLLKLLKGGLSDAD